MALTSPLDKKRGCSGQLKSKVPGVLLCLRRGGFPQSPPRHISIDLGSLHVGFPTVCVYYQHAQHNKQKDPKIVSLPSGWLFIYIVYSHIIEASTLLDYKPLPLQSIFCGINN